MLLAALAVTGQNPRNVVLYNLTDTDCGPCSCMDSIIRNVILPAHPQTVVIALHSPMPNSYFNEYQGKDIYFTFHSEYEPSGFIDGLGYDVPFAHVADSVAKRFADSPEAPVNIHIDSKAWDPGTRKLTLNLTMTNLSGDLPGAYWYNLFVTESHIKHMHRTFTGCLTPDVEGLPFRNDYYNDHVTRKLEFFSHGDSLIGPSWPSNQQLVRNLEIAIDTAWVPENCYVAVVVYRKIDSLYKSPVMQAISQNVTAPAGIGQTGFVPSGDGLRTIYPNPATDWVNIHMAVAKKGHCHVELCDQLGKTVLTLVDQECNEAIYNLEFNVKGLVPGVYHCVMTTDSGKWEKPLVIRH
jgi:hypothetical protein